jgi:hypothetical protein
MMMSQPYTIALWTADADRYVSFAAAHLLHEGLQTANRGRLVDLIPVSIGVANARRRPILSREVSARGLVFSREPYVTTPERYDYLLTFTSGDNVDSLRFRGPSRPARVIHGAVLLDALERVSPNSMSKEEVLGLFSSVARPSRPISQPSETHVELGDIADVCQRLVMALAS